MFRTISTASLSRARTNVSQKSICYTESVVEREERALAELKELCRKNCVTWPKSDLVPEAASDDNFEESNLLRYLRARKHDVHVAFKQYAASARWRHDIQLEKTYDDVDITRFETVRRLQPQWTGHRVTTGVPIMVYIVSQVKPDDILALHKTDPALSSIFLAAKYVTRFVQLLCGKLQLESINTSINIIDLSHVGVPTFWRLRKLLSTAGNMATAHYPGTIERIYVIGAPDFFPTIWRFITLWFKPATTRKIAVLGQRESATVLCQDLGPENVPKRFGGDLDWEFGGSPELSPDAKSLSKKWVDKCVQGPLQIIDGPGEKREIIAVGSQNGESSREEL